VHILEKEKALAKLSLAAISIDLLLSISLWRLGMDYLAPERRPQFVAPIALFCVMIAHLFVVEVLFGGHSLGRLCCGLTISSAQGGEGMPFFQRIKRFILILTRFGLGSLNPNRLPSYNCSAGVIFRSDFVGQAPVRNKGANPPIATPVAAKPRSSERRREGPVLRVTAGPHSGTEIALSSGSFFAENGLFHIGRTAGWADFTFDKDARVSSRQCRIYARDGKLFVADGEAAGKPSRNGTLVNGKALSTDSFQPLASGASIRIGESAFELIPA
jgi:hypothetical protein